MDLDSQEVVDILVNATKECIDQKLKPLSQRTDLAILMFSEYNAALDQLDERTKELRDRIAALEARLP